MTKIITVDCDKWKTIIAITLWCSLTLGLVVGFILSVHYIQNPVIVPPAPSIYNNTQSNSQYYNLLVSRQADIDKNDLGKLLYVLTLIGNIINIPFICFTLNNHYKWLEIKCGVKSK